MKRLNPEYERKVLAARRHARTVQRQGLSLHSEIQSLRRMDADPVFLAELERLERASHMHANAQWSTAYKNSLPDSAFFYVDQSCVHSRDAQGRSHPLNCRHFPYKDRSGKVSISHVRNAISRAPQSRFSRKVIREVQEDARRILARRGGYAEEPELQEAYAMAANVSIRIPNMPGWKQISGDMDPGKYGALIARSDGSALELREIQPVREYVGDDEAADVGYPFWSKEAYYDLDDLSPSNDDVRQALVYMDIDLEGGTGAAGDPEWTPETRALAIAEALMRYGSGVDEGPSGWSRDVVPGEVEWWGGTAGAEFIADEDDEFRQDILGEEVEEEFESNPRPVEAIPSKRWRHRSSGRTASPFSATPWSGRAGDRREDWVLETVGWTVRNDDGTVGSGRRPFKTKGEAETFIEQARRRHAEYSRNASGNQYWRSSKAISAHQGGKFDTTLDEMVYGISLDGGGDEEVGDADELGFALIMRNGPDIANAIHDNPPGFAPRHMTQDERDFLHEEGRAGVIVFIDSQGFVQVVYYDRDEDLEADWTQAVEELSGPEED